jgi:hypothetical protein
MIMKKISKPATSVAIVILLGGLLIGTQGVAADKSSSKKASRADPMQVVRGAKAWKNNCGRCHNLRSPKELTDEEWDVSTAHMRVRANLDGKDAEDIKAFLKASN